MNNFKFYALSEYESFKIEKVLPLFETVATVFEAIDPQEGGETILISLKLDKSISLDTFKDSLLNFQNNIYFKKIISGISDEIILGRFQICLDNFLKLNKNKNNCYDIILKQIGDIQLSNMSFKKDFILIECNKVSIINIMKL